MKLKALSLLVPILTVGAVHAAEIYNKDANKLDLYGKVDGLHYFSKDSGNDGDQSYARLGFKGETQISSGLKGFGQWEANFTANDTEGANGMTTRLAFAGLNFGTLGTVDYGRNNGVVYDITSYTDQLPEFGGDTYGTDNYMQGRIAGALTYHNDDFFGLVNGLNFALQYQGKNTGFDLLNQNGDGFAASVSYNIGNTGLTVGGALSTSNRTTDQNATDAALFGHGDRAATYTAGVKYDANNVYLAAHYTQTYNATRFGSTDHPAYGFADKAQNFEVVAQYNFDFGLVPSLAYLQSRGSDIKNGTTDYGNQDLLKYVDIGATYNFNKNMSAYVDYKINLLKDDKFIADSGTSKDDIVALGLVYQF